MVDINEQRIDRIEKSTGASRSSIERLLNENSLEFKTRRFSFKSQGFLVLLFAFALGWFSAINEPVAKEFLGNLRGSIVLFDDN